MFDRPTFHATAGDDVLSSLVNVLGVRPDRTSVARLVRGMTRIAVAYLRLRERRHSIRHQVSPLSESDLALECIADLFRTDATGRFVDLQRRFAAIDVATGDPESVLAAVRRLVIRKVDDGLFRMLQESDPSLARLIRGLKRAALGRDDVRIEKRHGVLWLVVDRDGDDGLPTLSGEVFEHLLVLAGVSARPATLLDTAIGALRSQGLYAARVPIVSAALALRACVVRCGLPPEVRVADEPAVEDARQVAIAAVRKNRRLAVVNPHSDGASYEDVYIACAADIVASQFTGDGSPTHYEAISKHLPTVSPAEYRRRHRTRFEYVVRQTRSAFVEMMRGQT